MSISLSEFLYHILDECNYILEVSQGKTREEIFDDKTLNRAIIRSLEIIGEAAKKLDNDFRLKYPHVEWKKITGTRDIMTSLLWNRL